MKQKIGSLLILFELAIMSLQAQMREIYVDPTNPDNDVMKISMYNPAQGFVAFSNWVGYTTDSGRSYLQKYITTSNVDYNGFSVNLTFGFQIVGVQAFSSDTLLVYGNYGFVPAILYSTDQGNTFKLVYQSQLNAQQLTAGITDMYFPTNSNIGFATEADRIIKTGDGGRTWFSIREDPNSFFSFIEPVGNNTLFVFSTNNATPKLLSTVNGGSSWQQLNIPPGKIDYASFISGSTGWLSINYPAALFYTSNGGVSWTQKNNPDINPFTCTKMKFLDDSTGYADGDNYTTYKTSDSGRVWEPLPRDNNYSYLLYNLTELRFFNSSQFWSGGGHGFLEITTDGGGTPLPKSYFSVDTMGVNQTGTVNLNNFSRPGYQYKWFVNGILVSTNYNTTYTHTLSNQSDSIELIVSNGSNVDTSTKIQYFIVPNLPAITSFTTMTGSTGTLVTIMGSGLGIVSSVSFGGVPAASFTIISPSEITAIVGSGATGSITVTDIHGSYSLPGFTYYAPSVSAPPVISSLSPASGPVGTTVTLTGSNFDPTPANNIIYFGATRAAISSSTTTQITCKLPSGASYQPVSVLNTTTGLTGHSLTPFNITFTDSSNFTLNSFTKVYSFSSLNYIYTKYIMGKDIDGDGKPDITAITQTYADDSIIIFRNTTSGNNFSFDAGRAIGMIPTLGSGKFDMDDLDGDGRPDIISVTNQPYLNLRRNGSSPGSIFFDNPILLQCPASTSDVKIGDIDMDGKNDIIAGTYGSSNGIAVYRNTSVPGFLSFATPAALLTTAGAGTLAIGDLDGDGKNDVVSLEGNGPASTLSCYHNTSSPGNISFDPHIDFPVAGSASQTNSITLADIDNDGKLDVIFANDNKYYCIFRNTSTPGNISFAAPMYYPSISIGGAACVAGLSGDSKPDYIATGGGNGTFSIARNSSTPGNISFDKPINNPDNVDSYYTNTGDFNADGKTDIVVSNTGNSEFAIYRNNVGDSIHFSLCQGSGSEITADLNGTHYQWQIFIDTAFINIGDNINFFGTQAPNLYFSNIPYGWNGFLFRCIVDSQYSSTFVMKVNGTVPPTITISASDSNICYGSPVTFSAVVSNPGSSPSITWELNGNATGPDSTGFTANLLTEGNQVRAILSGNNACFVYQTDTSNTVTIHLTGTKPSVTIQASDTVICDGTNVLFKALPVTGTLTPTYEWQVNGLYVGENLDSFSSATMQNGDQVTLIFLSTTGCMIPSVSNTITMTVNPSHTPTVMMNSSADTICAGTPVLFTASASDTGAVVIYQWQKNSASVGINIPFYLDSSLADGDIISVNISTLNLCATDTIAVSNSKKMVVISKSTISGSIAGVTDLNAGQASNLTASATNSAGAITYQWQDSTSSNDWQNLNGGTTNALIYIPKNTADEVRCVFSSNSPCTGPLSDTSNTLVFFIQNTPLADSGLAIKYFPNPVSTTLFIDSLNLNDQWQSFEMFNSDGGRLLMTQQIQNQTSVSIDVRSVETGIYIGVLRRKSGAPFVFKFLKL